jgi:A/G-specific adenine glycosylase
MLQQTQVNTVIPYFNRFIKRFPDVQSLASSDIQDVLKAWEGLGYYSRARNLHRAAQIVLDKWKGELPKGYEALQKLPGFGPYTAAAVASIAFGEAVPVVDGNVVRVFCRFWGIEDDVRNQQIKKQIFNQLRPCIQNTAPSDFNQSIMELGALVCTPSKPLCHICPLQPNCVAFNENRTDSLPVKSKAKPTPHYQIAVGVIWKDGKILIARRKEDKMLGGLWEFPGGKRKGRESLKETVLRETKEETALSIAVRKKYCKVKHAYTHFKITLTAFKCDCLSGTAQPLASDDVKWVSLEKIDRFPFPKANIDVIKAIKNDEECRA